MDNSLEISIIIVSWNTAEITCGCLQSIYDQSQKPNFEIILIDNASSDNSVELIRERFPDVILIENEQNVGFANANNQGIEIAKGKYQLLLNSDTIILDSAINKILNYAENKPEAGLFGCKLLFADKSLQVSCFMYPSITNLIIGISYFNHLFPKNKFFGREQMLWWNHDDEREVETIMGAFMLARTEAIKQVGGMDPDFFMYGEETDWCCRFKEHNWKILFTPYIEIIHLKGQSSKQAKAAMALQLRAGILQFIHKHHSFPYYYFACILTSIWFSTRTLPLFLKLILKPKTFGDSLKRINTYLIGAVKSLLGFRVLSPKRKP